jgi:hypothetical protein
VQDEPITRNCVLDGVYRRIIQLFRNGRRVVGCGRSPEALVVRRPAIAKGKCPPIATMDNPTAHFTSRKVKIENFFAS